jgi:hypothetical protein
MMQQTEVPFRERIHTPVKLDNARVHESGAVLTLTGDECRENGGTRELKVFERVHSPSEKT